MYSKPITESIQKQLVSVVQKYINRRLKQDVTRSDLAKEMGISYSTLQNHITNGGRGVGLESLLSTLVNVGGEINVTVSLLHLGSEKTYKTDKGNKDV